MNVKFPNQIKFFMTHNKIEGYLPSAEGDNRLQFFSKLLDEIVNAFPVKKIGVGLYTNSETPELTLILLLDKELIGSLKREDNPELWDRAIKEVEILYGDSPEKNTTLEQIVKQRFAYAYCEDKAEKIIQRVAKEFGVDSSWVNVAIVFDEDKFEGVPYVDWVEIYDDSVGMLNGEGVPYEAFEVLMFEKQVIKRPRAEGILNLSLFKNLLKVFNGYNIEYEIKVDPEEGVINVEVLNDPNGRLEDAIKDVLVRNNIKELPGYIKIVQKRKKGAG